MVREKETHTQATVKKLKKKERLQYQIILQAYTDNTIIIINFLTQTQSCKHDIWLREYWDCDAREKIPWIY